jgi:acyl-CoA reductase-like NAD-dependent aldehyde dehydrogenase
MLRKHFLISDVIGPHVFAISQRKPAAGKTLESISMFMKVLASSPRKPAFYPPTVIVDAPHSFICDREFFGPVVTVHTFKSEAEAICMANAGWDEVV